MAKLELGYWNIHGLVSPIRFLLEIAGVDYENKLYPIEDRDAWLAKKDSLGFDYPNLPYVVDGDIKMSEHLPIMRYISRKHGLAPTTENEIILSDQTESFVLDMRFRFYMVAYAPADIFDAKKAEWLDVTYKKLPYLNNLLAKTEYVTGSRLTYVDVYLYDFLLVMRAFEPELITKHAHLARFFDTINKHPKIAAYFASDRFQKTKFCAPFSTWNAELFLRALSSVLVLSPEELSNQPIESGSPISPYIILYLLFGYADSDLQSPHTSAGWTNEKLLQWLDGHTSDKERLELVSGALQKYRTIVRQKSIAQYDPVYPVISNFLEKFYRTITSS